MYNNEIINRQWKELLGCVIDGKYKHYSFDFWNTIAFSNSKYKEERADFIHYYFDQKYSKDLINNVFAKVGKDYNISIDNNGSTLTNNELYLKVFEYIGVNEGYDIEFIKSSIYELFLKYPPSISRNFYNILDAIVHNNISLSITSNTAFIPGNVIDEFLKKTGIFNTFSFRVFSDEVQVAKPNQKIFDIVLRNIESPIISANDVLHIGDNYKADYLGALYSGFSAFYIGGISQLNYPRYALHVIDNSESVTFSKEEYSKFKYGYNQYAVKYGDELFIYFENNILKNIISKYDTYYIYSSPYTKIPTASYYMTKSFYNSFTNYIKNNKILDKNIKLAKIARCQTYTEDYGSLTAEARYELIKNDTYQFVDIPTEYDYCIFIDDISITGTHQRVIEKILSHYSSKINSIFMYYAILNNNSISPTYESNLNSYGISGVEDIIDIILSDNYRITTRLTKYVLSLPDILLKKVIERIIENNKIYIIEEIIYMSKDNEYDKINIYKNNIYKLSLVLGKHKKN
jgi:FMN phosphatase YigB (HAD superfamily)